MSNAGNYPKRPRCANNACKNHYTTFTSRAGKEFNKCTQCENLVTICDHKGGTDVAQSGPNSKNPGRSYLKCRDNNCFVSWADSLAPPQPMPTQPVDTRIGALEKRVDALTVIVAQLKARETSGDKNEPTTTSDTDSGPGPRLGRQAATAAAAGSKRVRQQPYADGDLEPRQRFAVRQQHGDNDDIDDDDADRDC